MFPSASALWSFALIAALLTITPGVDTALVLRTAAVGARSRSWGVIAGIQLGTFSWGALSAVGVSALLAASELAYNGLRILGALYLIWIGAGLIRSASRPQAAGDGPAPERHDSISRGVRQGALTNLLNPKVGAFYVALLPQLIPATAPHLLWGLAFAGVHVLLGTVWLSSLRIFAHAARAWLQRPVVTRSIDGVVGVVIAGFGIRLALNEN